ncbi:MAG: hypothetical protein DMG13_26055 [Acidobacteria bacterium]|nr:MAG: hypothetical protein DMG13_26055 [Acidobacteriota bacterium]
MQTVSGAALSAFGANTNAGETQPAKRASVQTESRSWPKLVAHWKLDGDSRDAAGSHHGQGQNLEFVDGRTGRSRGAARFSGIESFIEIPDHEELQFGTGPFSIAVWVKLEQDLVSVIGDLLSKFDPVRRRGINLSITTSSPGYSGPGDAKNVLFGIDNGVNGSWIDCGRPSKSNPLIGTLTAYKGKLYAGVSDGARPGQSCRVYHYAGGMDWVDRGRVGDDLRTPSVYSMIVHQGRLYAGTGMYDWERARALKGGFNHVYVYEGGTQWRDCGEFSKGYRTTSLASFRGQLYAGDDYARCFRYEGGQKWASCGQLGSDWNVEKMFNTTTVYRGDLYAASLPGIYRYRGGAEWESIGREPFGTKQVHKLQVYGGRLYAGTWPFGKVLRHETGQQWTDCGQLGIATDKFQINEVNDLTVYNGKLYAGVIPKAEVYRYESGQEWTLLRRLVVSPDWSPAKIATWSRVPCLTIFQGRLFVGTSTCFGRYEPDLPAEAGRVFAMEAGKCVSYDDDLGAGWKHLVAVRERGRLKLYVNGTLQANAGPFDNDDYNVSNSAPLLIGFGAQNYFSGALDDVRIYSGALTQTQVADLYRPGDA